jgi:transposase InsO family protein
MSVDRACQISGVSRAGFYRAWQENEPKQAEMELRHRIQRLCLEYRVCGTRTVTKLLQIEGLPVGRRRIQRLMRLDNLLALRKRRYVVTTDSRHTYAVYHNLISEFKPSAANQLWVADITYIRLREAFVYLAVILDAWSRRVVGWALGETLEAELAVAALRRALADRHVPDGIIHHSDRGVQYCAEAYVKILQETGFAISMSRPGNPYDNALAESFMRTLKCEEVYLRRYRDVDDARERIGEFLEDYYNRRRLHSSLGYRTPADFEEARG